MFKLFIYIAGETITKGQYHAIIKTDRFPLKGDKVRLDKSDEFGCKTFEICEMVLLENGSYEIIVK